MRAIQHVCRPHSTYAGHTIHVRACFTTWCGRVAKLGVPAPGPAREGRGLKDTTAPQHCYQAAPMTILMNQDRNVYIRTYITTPRHIASYTLHAVYDFDDVQHLPCTTTKVWHTPWRRRQRFVRKLQLQPLYLRTMFSFSVFQISKKNKNWINLHWCPLTLSWRNK